MKKVLAILVALLTVLSLPYIGRNWVGADTTPPKPVVVEAPAAQKVVELTITRIKPDVTATMHKSTIKTLPLGKGTCSGEFIDAVGDIITAKHCTEGADSIEVTTYDNQHYEATILAQSTAHDLAIIHIDRLNTPYFKLADSFQVRQTVFALGSPLGITGTFSTGIVAKIDGDVTLVDLSVLPGNSGCPLFDANDRLLGVVTAVYIVGFGVTHLGIVQGLDATRMFIVTTLQHYYEAKHV